ncbi:TetR/AcrR family transcriptional regulator [Tenacibaculum jejuense]|uniref:TetR-type transcriptional regulator n=1 Tax=Tenacibaculum jejuense TaxID=584609 RepID=A0A238UE59_9FLAO|nr:TetR/AcrR family transcriptional regulator [Tenacibaculum jejuense]SNR16690.1 TetR-type transcriptional regulator [Tenacibaculum jejuense]
MTKKDSILKAALKLLTANGIHATPMSAIAKEAGTGMGTIYNYFPTKEILINHIYQFIKLQEQEIFEPFNPEEEIKAQFFNYYNVAVHFFIENIQYFQFMEQLHASPIITDESRKLGETAAKEVYVLIATGKKRNIIKPLETQELLQFIGGSLLTTIRWNIQNTNTTYIDNQLKLVWDAIKV